MDDLDRKILSLLATALMAERQYSRASALLDVWIVGAPNHDRHALVALLADMKENAK